MELAFSFMADGAFAYNSVNIFPHFGPKEMLYVDVQGLVQHKMACKGSSLGFSN